jgi:hypothetical protein
MNCSQTKEMLSAYLDAELPATVRGLVLHHLEACASCSEELHSFTDMSVMARSLLQPALPPEIWDRLSQVLEKAPLHPDRLRFGQGWRSSFFVFSLLAASLLILTGVAIWRVAPSRSGNMHEAKEFAEFARSFPTDSDGAQKLLLASYSGRAISAEALRNSPRLLAVATSAPPSGFELQQAYELEMPCCQCSQVVLRRSVGGVVSVIEHGNGEGPKLAGSFRCTNMQCGKTPCVLAQTGEYLAVSCRVNDRHFTIVGAANHSEVEVLVAWLEATGNLSSEAGERA